MEKKAGLFRKLFLGHRKAVIGVLFFCFFLILVVGVWFRVNSYRESGFIIKNTSTANVGQIVAGIPVKMVTFFKADEIKNGKHLLQLPKNASNVTVKKVTSEEIRQILTVSKAELSPDLRNQLINSINKPKASPMLDRVSQAASVLTSFISTGRKFSLADVSDALSVEPAAVEEENVAPATVEDPQPDVAPASEDATTTDNSTDTDVSTTTEPVVVEEENVTPAIVEAPQPDVAPVSDTTATDTPIVTTLPDVSTTTSSSTEATSSPQLPCQGHQTDDCVAVEYDVPAPIITAESTDTGQQVTVSAVDETVPMTDVLAYTKIPEIFKVGQESSIHIKWKNNGNQNVAFHAYDTDNNGKLNYVEWTVPHLSEQVFDIIFISKAFQLDADQNIVADIYDIVGTQDGNYASVPSGNYVRATFNSVLGNTKDITVYAKPASSDSAGSISVFPVYTDAYGNVSEGSKLDTVPDGTNPDFSNIDHDGKYRILLQNLQTPTDVFDLKISGSAIDFDYIVDPTGWLTGWSYRKSHVISAASGAGTLYQKKIIVHYGSGTDSADDVYCNSKCKTDFGDIRFTDNGGTTLLHYWMESIVSSDNAVFWVEVAGDLSTVDATVYAYYGNSGATTASSFVNTFIEGDTFTRVNSSGNAIGNTEIGNRTWHNGGGGSEWEIVSNQLKGIITSYAYPRTINFSQHDLALDFDLYVPSGATADWAAVEIRKTNETDNFTQSGIMIYFRDTGGIEVTGGSLAGDTTGTFTAGQSNRVSVRAYGDAIKVYINDSLEMDFTETTMAGGYMDAHSALNNITFDNYRIRKFVATEPANATWGTEESVPVPTTFTSTQTGAFNIGTTWGGACSSSCTAGTDFPNTIDTAVIANGTTVTLDSARTVAVLTVNSGGTFDPATYLTTIGGTFSVTGTIKVGASTFAGNYSATPTLNTGSTVEYNLGGTQTIANYTYSNLTTSGGSGTKSLAAATTVNGIVTIGAGTTLSTSGSNYNMIVGGNWTNSGTFTSGTGTVTFNGAAAQTITPGGSSFYNLISNKTGTVTNDDLTLVGNTGITNDFTLTDGEFKPVSYTVTLGGNLSVATASSGITFGTSTFVFDGVGKTISGTTNTVVFYNVTVNTDKSVTSNLNVNILGPTFTVNGTFTLGAAKVVIVSNINQALTIGDGGLVQGTNVTNSRFQFNTDLTPTINLTGTGNFGSNLYLQFYSDSDSNINYTIPSLNYKAGKVEIYSTSVDAQTHTFIPTAGTLDIDGDFILTCTSDMDGSLLNFNNSNNTAINIGGNFSRQDTSNTAKYTKGTADTVTFDGAGTQAFDPGASSVFGGVTHSGAGTLRLVNTNLHMDGAFLNSAGTFDANNRNMTFSGNWANNAGASGFTPGTGTVTFDGASAQTINSGGSNFNNVTLSNNTFTLLTNAMTVGGNLVISEAKTPVITATASEALTVTGATDGTTGGSAESLTVNTPGAVTFTGAVGTGVSTMLTALTITNSAALLFSNTINITGALTQTNAATGATTFTGAVSVGSAVLRGVAYTVSSTFTATAGGAVAVTNSGVFTISGTGALTAPGGFSTSGACTSHANITTTNTPLTIGGNLIIGDTHSITLAAGNGAITITGTTDGTGSFSFEVLTVNTTGNVTFTGAVGSGSGYMLGELFITNSAALLFSSTINMSAIDGNGDAIGVLTQTNAATGATTFTGAVSVGSAVLRGVAYTVSSTFTTTLGAGFGTIAVTNSGIFTKGGTGAIVAPGGFTTSGAATLSNNVTTTNTALSIGGNLKVGSGTTLTLSAGSGEITVTGTTDGSTGPPVPEKLVVNTTGPVTFTGAVGSGSGYMLGELFITNSAALLFSSTINLFGDQETGIAFTQTNAATGITTFTGAVSLGSATFRGTTINLGGITTISGDLNIAVGTLAAGANAVNVSGNWTNSGTFTSTGTVTLNGTNQSLTGSTTFYNLSKTDTTDNSIDAILTFDNTATQTIGGLLTLQGIDDNDRVNLVSNSPGTRWGLTANGTLAINWADTTDSDASGGSPITFTNTLGATQNNLNWSFNAAPNAPTLVSPADASVISDNTPTLSANYSDSDTGDTGTTNYRISSSSLADCTNNTSIVASGASAETATNNESTTWTPLSSLGIDRTYYWCAQNGDGVATSLWTQMGSFTLDTTAPTLSFTDDVAVGPVTSDTITGNWGDASFKKWEYESSSSCPASAGRNIYLMTDANSMNQTTEDNNTKYICLYGADAVGNSTTTVSANAINIDVTNPTSSIASPADNSLSSSTTVALTGTSADANLSTTMISVDGGSYVETAGTAGSWTYSATLLSQGAHTFRTQATDSAGNTGISALVHVTVDTIAPTVSDNAPSTWQVNDFVITLTCDDTTGGNTGCVEVYYTIDGTAPDTNSSFVNSGSGNGWQFTQATEGDYVLKYRGLDAVGNLADTVTAVNHLRLDKIAPTVSDNVPSGWQNSDITVTLTCDDATGGASGCTKVFYTLDGTDPDANSPLFVNSAGSWQFTYSTSTKDTAVLKYRGIDTAGNLEAVVSTLNLLEIDKLTPVISNIDPVSSSNISATGQTITFTLDKTGDCRLATSTKSYDDMAGDTSCSVNNGIQISCVAPDLGGAGSKDLYLACEDYLGNKDTAESATHVTYIVPSPAPSTQPSSGHSSSGGGQTRPVLPIVSTGAPTGPFNVSINNGAGVTSNRKVTLNFSAGAGATAVVISNNPDFSGAIIIPYQNSFEYDLCGGSLNCFDRNYTVYAKFLSSSGVDSPAVSAMINLRTSSFIEQAGDTASQFVDEISKVVQIFQPKKEVTTNFPPINISVPKDAPVAFQHVWNLTPASMQDFVFASLPKDLQNVILKFPQVADTLNKVGITRMNDIGQLVVAKISLPGLAESAGLSSIQGVSIPVADFSSTQAGKVPMGVVFARAGANNLDLNVKLSIDNQGAVAQTLNTVQGRPLTLAIKPDQPASGIKGYLIFKSNRVGSLTASVVNALEMNAPDLVLSQFDYKDSGNGIWTANVASPLVLGQYELRTVINYKKITENPKTVSMIVVVDPEGYVYRKLGDGSEARITGASVSIYWLNPKTNQYELWSAKDFRQENPQTTDVTGRYSFLVPPGSYYLKATASSYSDYKSDVFKVEENKGVFMNIELIAKFSWMTLFNLQTVLLGGIFIILAYFAVIFTLRRKGRI